MSIDAEALERLLTDRALGGLPTDTEALLAAYLAERNDARVLSARIDSTVAAARTALADRPATRIPAFPVDRLRDRLAARRRWVLVGRITSLAACVLMGIGLHAAWMVAPTPVGPSANTITVAQQPVPSINPTVRVATEEPRPGFWSGRRWYERYERAEQNRSERSQRVIWDSPLTRPRLGDAT